MLDPTDPSTLSIAKILRYPAVVTPVQLEVHRQDQHRRRAYQKFTNLAAPDLTQAPDKVFLGNLRSDQFQVPALLGRQGQHSAKNCLNQKDLLDRGIPLG